MDLWSWLWLGWIVLVAATFFALEIPAYRDGVPGNTLSERVWVLLAAKGRLRRFRTVIRLGLLFFFVWLILHFFTGYV